MEKQIEIGYGSEVYLTKTGLLVAQSEDYISGTSCATPFFCDNNGGFRRYASTDEVETARWFYPTIVPQDNKRTITVVLPYEIPPLAEQVDDVKEWGKALTYSIVGNKIVACLEAYEVGGGEERSIWAQWPNKKEIRAQLEVLGFQLVG